MSAPGHHAHHGLCRGAQALADRTSAGAEGFVARVTDASLLRPRMDTKGARARLASGRAVRIGAAYGCGAMMVLLALGGSMPRGGCRDPHFCYT
jgi:hypothetical protein